MFAVGYERPVGILCMEYCAVSMLDCTCHRLLNCQVQAICILSSHTPAQSSAFPSCQSIPLPTVHTVVQITHNQDPIAVYSSDSYERCQRKGATTTRQLFADRRKTADSRSSGGRKKCIVEPPFADLSPIVTTNKKLFADRSKRLLTTAPQFLSQKYCNGYQGVKTLC